MLISSDGLRKNWLFDFWRLEKGDESLVRLIHTRPLHQFVCHVGRLDFCRCAERFFWRWIYEKFKVGIITEKTKAIIPVDLGGIPCDYEKIFSIVEKTALSAWPMPYRKRMEELQYVPMPHIPSVQFGRGSGQE